MFVFIYMYTTNTADIDDIIIYNTRDDYVGRVQLSSLPETDNVLFELVSRQQITSVVKNQAASHCILFF